MSARALCSTRAGGVRGANSLGHSPASRHLRGPSRGRRRQGDAAERGGRLRALTRQTAAGRDEDAHRSAEFAAGFSPGLLVGSARATLAEIGDPTDGDAMIYFCRRRDCQPWRAQQLN